MTVRVPQSYVSFHDVGSFLAFLRACELGETGRGLVERSDYETVCYHEETQTLSVTLPSSSWGDAGLLHGGEFHQDRQPPGKKVDLNEILHMLPICAVSTTPKEISSLLLRTRSFSERDRLAVERLLYDAWSTVERAEQAQSRFYYFQEAGGDHYRFAVLIDGVSRDFDLGAFEKRQADIEAFLPAFDPGEGAGFLYVRAGFVHSHPAEFHLLYDQPVEEGFVICAPKLAARLGDRWQAASFTRVDGQYAIRSGDAVRLDFGGDEGEVDVLSSDPESRLQILLQQGSGGASVAVKNDLEQRIGRLERSLEDLNAHRARSRATATRDYFAVFAFHQTRDLGADTIPAGLEMFMRRTLTEISQYRLVYVPQPATALPPASRADEEPVGIHYVISTLPMSLTAALAVWCDHIYLCDLRWDAWGLPLYVRTDFSLSVDIEEAEVAEKVAALIKLKFEQKRTLVGSGVLLAEPLGEVRPGGPLAFTQLQDGVPLEQALRFTNHLGGSFGHARNAASADLEHHEEELGQELRKRVGAADEALRGHARAQIGEFDKAWNDARERIRQLALQRQLIEGMSTSVEELLESYAQSWDDFTEQTFRHWHWLAAKKINARHSALSTVAQLDKEYQNLNNALAGAIEEAKTAEQRLEVKRGEFEAKLVVLKGQIAKIGPKAERVADLHRDAVEEAALIAETVARIKQQRMETDDNLKSVRVSIKRAISAQRELNKEEEELAQLLEELRAGDKMHDATMDRLWTLRQNLALAAPSVARRAAKCEKYAHELKRKAERFIARGRKPWWKRWWS